LAIVRDGIVSPKDSDSRNRRKNVPANESENVIIGEGKR